MKSLHGAQLKAKSAQVSWILDKKKNLGTSSFFTSSHMGGVGDDVTEAARLTMTELKILKD